MSKMYSIFRYIRSPDIGSAKTSFRFPVKDVGRLKYCENRHESLSFEYLWIIVYD
jgi:hypothetical protein